MTKDEAHTEAEKRERHKSKHMTHKRWSAVHNSVKGWHVALINTPAAVTADIEVRPDMVALAVCVALFGPTATVQALAALERRDERLKDIPRGGTIKPGSFRTDNPRIASGPEYFIPRMEKKP